MKKKYLTFVLAMILGTGVIHSPVQADDSSGYRLLYENTFDDGIESFEQSLGTETDDYIFTGDSNNLVTAEFDGETGIAAKYNKWPSTVMTFDFTKGGTKNGVKNGIYKISMDISLYEASIETTWMGVNMDTTKSYEGQRYIAMDNGALYLNNNFGAWGNEKINLDYDKKYHLEMVLNFGTKAAATYIDGGFAGNTTGLDIMNNFSIALCAYCDFMDNLRVEYYDSMPMNVSVKSAASDKIELEFTDGIANSYIFENGITLKSIYTGEKITSAVEANGKNAVITPPKALSDGYAYRVILPEGIRGREGGTLSESAVDFSLARDNSLKSLRLKNLQGETFALDDKNPAELHSIVFEFSDDVNAADALSRCVISDADGNTADFDITASGNVGETVFCGALRGNKTYTITLDGLGCPYEILLNTAEGRLAPAQLKVYAQNGSIVNSVDEITVGSTVTVVLEVVNTSADTVKVFSAVTVHNGRLMKDINFEKAELSPGTKEVIQIPFVIDEKTNLYFTGTVWDTVGTYPLADGVYFGNIKNVE